MLGYRDVKDLPLGAQQVFGPPGTYKIVIQVDGDEIAPVQVILEVKAAEGPKPEKAGLWRGIAEVAILAQGSPTVETS